MNGVDELERCRRKQQDRQRRGAEWGRKYPRLCLIFARLYTIVWYRIPWKLRPVGGRHTDPDPISCECGWAGMRRWAEHGYQDDGSGEDVEPVDFCPGCGEEI